MKIKLKAVCTACGAQTFLPPGAKSARCPACGGICKPVGAAAKPAMRARAARPSGGSPLAAIVIVLLLLLGAAALVAYFASGRVGAAAEAEREAGATRSLVQPPASRETGADGDASGEARRAVEPAEPETPAPSAEEPAAPGQEPEEPEPEVSEMTPAEEFDSDVEDPPEEYDPPPEPDVPEEDGNGDFEPEGYGDLIETALTDEECPSVLRPVPENKIGPCDTAGSESAKRRSAVKAGPHGVSPADASAGAIYRSALRGIPSARPFVTASTDPGIALEIDRAWIISQAGAGAFERVAGEEGGVEFLDAFLNDPAWLEEFAGSGPPKHGFAGALETLSLLWWNDTAGWIASTDEGRRVATAIALNCKPGRDAANVSLFNAYSRFARTGRLHKRAYENTCREWRQVINGGFPAEELKSMNRYRNSKYDAYSGVIGDVPYRLRNCFDESVHDPKYYKPWLWLRQWADIAVPVGGVCGALSKFASRCVSAHGIPSVTAGQPGHCAFLERRRDGTWRIGNYISVWTHPHWTIFGKGYHAVEAVEYMYEIPSQTALSERNRRFAELLRHVMAEKKGSETRSKLVEGVYRKAVEQAPGNILAWKSRMDWMEACGAGADEWKAFAAEAGAALSPSEWSGWEILDSCIRRAAEGGGTNALYEAVAAAHKAMRESPRPVAERYDYGSLLASHSKMFNGDKTAMVKLFDDISTAQQGTATFFDAVIAWAGDIFMDDPATSRPFLKTISRLADPATYSGRYLEDRERAQKSGGKPPKIDFNSVAYAAARALNFEGFREAIELSAKLAKGQKNKNAKKDGRKPPKFPLQRFGGEIVSKGAIPLPEPFDPNFKGNTPVTWLSFSDESPAGAAVLAAGKSDNPSIELALPFETEMRGMVIWNVDESRRSPWMLYGPMFPDQYPLVLSASEDGKTWTEFYSEPFDKENGKARKTWEIDLQKKPVRAKYIRAERQAGVTNAPLAFAKMVVYGRKAPAVRKTPPAPPRVRGASSTAPFPRSLLASGLQEREVIEYRPTPERRKNEQGREGTGAQTRRQVDAEGLHKKRDRSHTRTGGRQKGPPGDVGRC